MSDNNKEFFEQLAGIPNEQEQESFEPELVKADILSKKLDKIEDDEEEIVPEKRKKNPIEEIDFEDAEGHLTIDVYQDAENIYIESAIAGVDSDDIDVAITPESVVIKGKREKLEKVKTDDYLYQECFWGNFSRSVILPQEIDPDKSTASMKNGVLKISLPKVSRQKGKRVKIKLD